MHARAAPLAACVILALSVVSGCRRPPPAARAPDGGTDGLAERMDADATADGPADIVADIAADIADETGNVADSALGEPASTDALADVAGDLPQDILIDTAIGDAAVDAGDTPPDASSPDGPISDGSDARPEDQPCGSLGISCRPYTCDVARGICKAVCLTDDDCAGGVHCTATNRCGSWPDTPCTSDSVCQSGHCAQGACCQTACNQRCYSCGQVTAIGTCLPVPAGALDPFGTCPNGMVCDGRGACIPPSCTTDAECGTLHLCTNGRCIPCTPTCVTDAECTAPAICVDRNFCTSCALPDAGTGQ